MKFNPSLALGIFSALCLTAVPACDDKKADDKKADAKKGDEKKADDKKGDEKPAEAEDDKAPEADDAEDGGDLAEGDAKPAEAGKVGVESCDTYITQYSACIDENAPEGMKKPLKDGIAKNAERWRSEMEGPGKDAVDQACTAALEAVKKTSKNCGCS